MLSFGKFVFTLCALDLMELPAFKGSTLHGAWGQALHKIVCITHKKECQGCPYLRNCIYAYFFETPSVESSKIRPKYRAVPHPYIFEVEDEHAWKTVFLPGETFAFTLVLIGKAVEYVPHIVYAFEELGKKGMGKKRGKFHLQQVSSLSPDGRSAPLYEGKFLDKARPAFFWEPVPETPGNLPDTRSLELVFETPTRLKEEGKLSRNIEFVNLMKRVFSRLTMLSYFHCGEEINFTFQPLVDAAQKVALVSSTCAWKDLSRYSSSHRQKLDIGGIVGKAVYAGEITPFMPFLDAGAHLHVGSCTAFGLGKYNYVVKE